MSCNYCKEKELSHIDSNDIIQVLSKMSEKDRAITIRYIKQMKSDKYHTTIAEKDIDETYCYSCGSIMERDDDDDRYYYLCSNMNCKSWNNGDIL